MASSRRATALMLDASELRKLTGWPDSVIEEFLSLQGATTITGSVIIPAAATSFTVPVGVNAKSIIMATVAQIDTTLKAVAVVAASNSFDLIPNAAPTADCRVDWVVFL